MPALFRFVFGSIRQYNLTPGLKHTLRRSQGAIRRYHVPGGPGGAPGGRPSVPTAMDGSDEDPRGGKGPG